MRNASAVVLALFLALSFSFANEDAKSELKNKSVGELNYLFNDYVQKINELDEAYALCGESCSKEEYSESRIKLKGIVISVLEEMRTR